MIDFQNNLNYNITKLKTAECYNLVITYFQPIGVDNRLNVL